MVEEGNEMGNMVYQLQERIGTLIQDLHGLDTTYHPQLSAISNKLTMLETNVKTTKEHLLHTMIASDQPATKSTLANVGRMTFATPKQEYVARTQQLQKHFSYKARVHEGEEDLPSISEDDISKGMLNLITKGIIPKDVDLTPAFTRGAPPLSNKPVLLYPQEAKKIPAQIRTGLPQAHQVRFDFTRALTSYEVESPLAIQEEHAIVSEEEYEEKVQESVHFEPRGYDQLLDEYSSHLFIIRKGKVLDQTPEFISYKRTYQQNWTMLSHAISYLEKFLTKFAVPKAQIDGKKLFELLGKRPDEEELFGCVANQEVVRPFIRIPKIQYQGEMGQHKAAIRLQSAWRCYKTYTAYQQLKFLITKARIIQKAFRNFLDLKNTRRQAALLFKQKLEKWRNMQDEFKNNWENIKSRPRLEIHICSLSIDEARRLTMEKYLVKQNLQISRIFRLQDPNVKVVYVSAFDLTNQIIGYYTKVLEIGDIADPSSKLILVSPNIGQNIPTHISTTKSILFSPPTLKRLKQIIRHTQAYIVPGPMSKDEVELSIQLGVPVLGGDPYKSALYSTKSGSKRILTAAEVPIPPGAYDIYDEKEFLATLTRLIANHIFIDTWLFKIDNEFQGRGHAYLEVGNFKLIKNLRKSLQPLEESQQEKLYFFLSKVLPTKSKICTQSLYPSWKAYMKEFVRVGGVIEATPVCSFRNTGSVCVSFLIEPDGGVELIGAYNKIECRRYVTAAYSFPQTHLPNMNMKLLCSAIAAELVEKEVIGYINVDLISFPNDSKGSTHPLFWGVDIDCYLSNVGSVSGFYDFLMEGKMESTTGLYYLDHLQNTRSFLYIPYINHPGIAKVLYKTFFYMCRVKGISFDLEQRRGTAFVLPDTLQSAVLGLLTVGKNQKMCFKYMLQAFEFITTQGAMPLVKIAIREDFRDDAIPYTEILSMVKIVYRNFGKIRKK